MAPVVVITLQPPVPPVSTTLTSWQLRTLDFQCTKTNTSVQYYSLRRIYLCEIFVIDYTASCHFSILQEKWGKYREHDDIIVPKYGASNEENIVNMTKLSFQCQNMTSYQLWRNTSAEACQIIDKSTVCSTDCSCWIKGNLTVMHYWALCGGGVGWGWGWGFTGYNVQ